MQVLLELKPTKLEVRSSMKTSNNIYNASEDPVDQNQRIWFPRKIQDAAPLQAPPHWET